MATDPEMERMKRWLREADGAHANAATGVGMADGVDVAGSAVDPTAVAVDNTTPRPASKPRLQAHGSAYSRQSGAGTAQQQQQPGEMTPTRPAAASKVSTARQPSHVSRASRASAASRASQASQGSDMPRRTPRMRPGVRYGASPVRRSTSRFSSRQSYHSTASSRLGVTAASAGTGNDDDDAVGPVVGPIQPHVPRRPRYLRAPPRAGPATYQRMRNTSGFSKQPVSNRVTLPSFGFGRAPRIQAKLYAGHSLADAHPSNETRDATTCNTVGAMGRQVDSRKTSAPAASFGSSPRFSNKAFISRAHAAVDQVGVDSPGAVYARASQFRGARVKGGRKNRRWRQQKNVAIPNGKAAPAFSFGSGKRTLAYLKLQHRAVGDDVDEPGPGSFNPDDIKASRRRGPAFSFGTEKRERSVKVSLGRGADAALLGSASPGPMAYFPDVSTSAAHKSGPSHGFGDYVGPCYSDPLKPRPKPAPGPSLPHQDFGVEQANSKLPSAARTRFGAAAKDPSFELPSRAVPGPGAYSPINPQPSGFVPSPVKLSELAQPSIGGFTFALAPRSTPPPM